MELKSQDILIVLKIVAYGSESWNYPKLSKDLGLSLSMVHSSIKRSEAARLFETHGTPPKPARSNLKEFLVHGVKYAFPAETGSPTRGLPTSYAAPPLDKLLIEDTDLPPVWPYSMGSVRGTEFSPLHPKAPAAAMKDPKLYELLALLDAIRGGRARERELAVKELSARVSSWR